MTRALYINPSANLTDEERREIMSLMPCCFCGDRPAPNPVVWVPTGDDQEAAVLRDLVAGAPPPPPRHVRYITVALCDPCWSPYSGREEERLGELVSRIREKLLRGDP